MFINGTFFGDSINTCYMPFTVQDQQGEYASNQIDFQNTWILGQIVFNNHYTVFDMQPFTDDN